MGGRHLLGPQAKKVELRATRVPPALSVSRHFQYLHRQPVWQ